MHPKKRKGGTVQNSKQQDLIRATGQRQLAARVRDPHLGLGEVVPGSPLAIQPKSPTLLPLLKNVGHWQRQSLQESYGQFLFTIHPLIQLTFIEYLLDMLWETQLYKRQKKSLHLWCKHSSGERETENTQVNK